MWGYENGHWFLQNHERAIRVFGRTGAKTSGTDRKNLQGEDRIVYLTAEGTEGFLNGNQ